MTKRNNESQEDSVIRKRAWQREYRSKHVAEDRISSARWYRNNKKRALAYSTEYRKKNPEINRAATRRYRAKVKSDPVLKLRNDLAIQRRRNANRDRYNAYQREYNRRKTETDLNFVIKNRLRSRLHKKLKSQRAKKSSDTMALTGCTPEFLRGYLEARFKAGMTWKNIHIDHIIPCAEFDLRDPEQQRKCFHYSNLQPLWGKDNLSKGARRPAAALTGNDLV